MSQSRTKMKRLATEAERERIVGIVEERQKHCTGATSAVILCDCIIYDIQKSIPEPPDDTLAEMQQHVADLQSQLSRILAAQQSFREELDRITPDGDKLADARTEAIKEVVDYLAKEMMPTFASHWIGILRCHFDIPIPSEASDEEKS